MPIDLRDLPSNTNIKNYSPKYFCDKLTGNSKGTRGLLTSMHDPAMINEKIMPSIPSAEYVACRRQKGVRNNNTETTSVPFNPLSSSVWDSMRQYTLPSLSKLCKFGTDKKHDMTGYLQLCVHSLILEETTKPATAKTQSSISRKLVVCYQLFFFFKKGNSADRHDIVTHISSVNPSGYNRNIYGFLYTHTPVKAATKIAENLANLGWDIDTTALLNYFTGIGMDKETAGSWCSLILVALSVLLTGLNLYPKLAKFGGAGTLVPITGFANSVAASAIEYKKEGQVFGIGCKIFTIAGPVILYGIFSSWLLRLIYWILRLCRVVA